jgi:hypothetical protein
MVNFDIDVPCPVSFSTRQGEGILSLHSLRVGLPFIAPFGLEMDILETNPQDSEASLL